jgi:enoyl-CoA hydratase
MPTAPKDLPDFAAITINFLPNAALLRFNRPETKNPLSVSTLAEIERALDWLEADEKIKTIIFTGSGGTFASGANLNEVAKLDENSARAFGRRGQSLLQRIYDSEKFTVAAIDGFCMGGALDLALSCRRRIASPRSIFAHPGASLGIITGWSGTQILPRLIGKKRALEMFLTAKRVATDEALAIGLIDEISENPLETAIANFANGGSS